VKKFKFKLEALLKLRKLEEDKVKMRLGKLNIEKSRIEDDLKNQNKSIDISYNSQEESLKTKLKAQSLAFYPEYVEAKYANIAILKSKLNDLNDATKNQLALLERQKAKTKVMVEMKEKKQTEHKKEQEKKMYETIEENNILWNALRRLS
jgi:flagellar FliJ protein